mmetsp:Transcript_41930/g.88030  ORF Transcript_41930/g.88030 Transcript_41930/m.88030 type:complete len:425 (+) Transcript_41930:469-1743(+)
MLFPPAPADDGGVSGGLMGFGGGADDRGSIFPDVELLKEVELLLLIDLVGSEFCLLLALAVVLEMKLLLMGTGGTPEGAVDAAVVPPPLAPSSPPPFLSFSDKLMAMASAKSSFSFSSSRPTPPMPGSSKLLAAPPPMSSSSQPHSSSVAVDRGMVSGPDEPPLELSAFPEENLPSALALPPLPPVAALAAQLANRITPSINSSLTAPPTWRFESARTRSNTRFRNTNTEVKHAARKSTLNVALTISKKEASPSSPSAQPMLFPFGNSFPGTIPALGSPAPPPMALGSMPLFSAPASFPGFSCGACSPPPPPSGPKPPAAGVAPSALAFSSPPTTTFSLPAASSGSLDWLRWYALEGIPSPPESKMPLSSSSPKSLVAAATSDNSSDFSAVSSLGECSASESSTPANVPLPVVEELPPPLSAFT